jgi:outer membrane murein-binding lipoprotein Lpp
LKRKAQRLEWKFSQLERTRATEAKSAQDKVLMLEAKVGGLEAETNFLKAALSEVQSKQAQATTRYLGLPSQASQLLEGVGGAPSQEQAGLSRELQEKFFKRLSSMETIVLGPESRLEKLHREISLVKSRTAGQGVQVGRFAFSTYSEMKVFVANAMNNNYGLCLDAVSLLHSIGSPNVDPVQAVATETTRLRAKYGSQLEMKVATSFKTSFPAVMFRHSTGVRISAAVAEGCLGPGMSSIEKWDARDGVSGTKFIIENGVRRMEDSIPFEIHESLDGDGADLALHCFLQSATSVHHLIMFIDTFFLEMSNAAGFKPKEAWSLVTAVVVKVFSDLRDARAISQDSRDAAGLIWGTLQAHMVMKRFLKNNFKRDPGLNAVLIEFILKRKQTDATAMLGGVNVKNLEAQVKRIERDVSDLKSKA